MAPSARYITLSVSAGNPHAGQGILGNKPSTCLQFKPVALSTVSWLSTVYEVLAPTATPYCHHARAQRKK
ncbi:uncharacterized protein TrAFT101_000720 [Trichoderma asperellum]|uniref:uncharacterized protein n=1 Tax=Trichoderma asperellum TaxID=101201 RepID=UPI003318041D|nr:hypothetical protein TrAFT101_000720 [Trichoderma asperellum]